jgi:hypothetical protein
MPMDQFSNKTVRNRISNSANDPSGSRISSGLTRTAVTVWVAMIIWRKPFVDEIPSCCSDPGFQTSKLKCTPYSGLIAPCVPSRWTSNPSDRPALCRELVCSRETDEALPQRQRLDAGPQWQTSRSVPRPISLRAELRLHSLVHPTSTRDRDESAGATTIRRFTDFNFDIPDRPLLSRMHRGANFEAPTCISRGFSCSVSFRPRSRPCHPFRST